MLGVDPARADEAWRARTGVGMIVGALVPSTQKVATWGMLPILVLSGISGIFYPIQELWGRCR